MLLSAPRAAVDRAVDWMGPLGVPICLVPYKMMEIAIRYSTANELAALLRDRSVSAVEMLESSLILLTELGPRYNALANLLSERAYDDARAADIRLSQRDPTTLCGIPYGVKDAFSARGAPTTWGAAAFSERVFDRDATAIRRLTKSGAVLTAKLSMSELGGLGQASRAGASLHGQARNPWNPSRYAGGSSGGSAVVVATGALPFSLGTETSGSVLGPAAYCGVTGYRPTLGTIPRGGVMTLAPSLDKVGVIARSADDCAIVREAITSRTPHQYRDELGCVRVGVVDRELAEIPHTMVRALTTGIEEFRRIFSTFVSVDVDGTFGYTDAIETLELIEGAKALKQELDRPDFDMTDSQQLESLRAATHTSTKVESLKAARVPMRAAQQMFRSLFSRVDILLSVTRPRVAPLLSSPRPKGSSPGVTEVLRTAGNLAGVPAVTLPSGLSREGLPVALQLLGPRGSDGLLLAVGAAYQRSTAYHLLRPPAE
ncbi:MAG: amidase [Chloroflexi bacterium]|nr:amidase [Chloroflexota bacterium]